VTSRPTSRQRDLDHDGQIFLQSDLFYSGVRPAIDVVTRVARRGAAQIKAMRSVAGRSDHLAQFRDLESFATFGSELDKSSQRQLDRAIAHRVAQAGPQCAMPVEEQCIRSTPAPRLARHDSVEDVRRFETELLINFRRNTRTCSTRFERRALPESNSLDAAMQLFVNSFAVTTK